MRELAKKSLVVMVLKQGKSERTYHKESDGFGLETG